MKKLLIFFIVLIPVLIACEAAMSSPSITREPFVISAQQEVKDVSALKQCISNKGRGVFLIDADEVLFTSDVTPAGEIEIIRLYEKLEQLISAIRDQGHQVFIVTYNHADVIRTKLQIINLDVKLFNGILSCEMEGDLKTAKGELFKRLIRTSEIPFDFAVFIDNFPPFVENLVQVSRELNVPLHAFIATGYIDIYYRYVYHHLSKLSQALADGDNIGDQFTRIEESLRRYRIDIRKFKESFPELAVFQEQVSGLIWPYLVYK